VITTLEIDNVEIPPEQLGEVTQTYSEIMQKSFARTADGSGYIRSTGTVKLRTSIIGKGWIPSAFENVDETVTHTLRCLMPRSASSNTTTVTLPSSRRVDAGHQPIGFALVADALVQTEITNLAAINAKSTNDATLTSVTGAVGYRVSYLPEITAAILSATCTGSGEASYEWTLEAEEV
jgi:hypothetical protein